MIKRALAKIQIEAINNMRIVALFAPSQAVRSTLA
jgi:hypothetical protein